MLWSSFYPKISHLRGGYAMGHRICRCGLMRWSILTSTLWNISSEHLLTCADCTDVYLNMITLFDCLVFSPIKDYKWFKNIGYSTRSDLNVHIISLTFSTLAHSLDFLAFQSLFNQLIDRSVRSYLASACLISKVQWKHRMILINL